MGQAKTSFGALLVDEESEESDVAAETEEDSNGTETVSLSILNQNV